jgi:hypothetical protein
VLAEFTVLGTAADLEWSGRIPNSPVRFNGFRQYGRVTITYHTSACTVIPLGKYIPPQRWCTQAVRGLEALRR